jgi:hypothetical protein
MLDDNDELMEMRDDNQLPTVSSKINFGDETPQNIQYDLWIVGAGTLGKMVARKWKERFPDAKIVAETATTRSHAELMSLGCEVRLREERRKSSEKRQTSEGGSVKKKLILQGATQSATAPKSELVAPGGKSLTADEGQETTGGQGEGELGGRFSSEEMMAMDPLQGCAKHLFVCIPPSAAPNGDAYSAEVNDARQLWAGVLGEGNFVFTSSTAVYGDSMGNIVNEKFRVDTRSKRSTNLLHAEESVLTCSGIALRLAGLYTAERGPHTFWLKSKTGLVDSPANGYINTLHYEDAAEASIAALLRGEPGEVYLACDDVPLSR